MRKITAYRSLLAASSVFFSATLAAPVAAEPVAWISPAWDKVTRVSETVVTVQVCPEPQMRRGHKLHGKIHKALSDLGADYARFQPWFTYPRFAVAELQAPENGKTYWNFSLMDPLVEDFMQASNGRPVVFSLGAIPSWMHKTRPTVPVPTDPDQIVWGYSRTDAVLDDSTVKLFAEYQARLAGWYINGGFTDEYGKWHASPYKYKTIEYWEPFNEQESSYTPEEIVRLYDASVEAIRKVAPNLKFVGPAFEDALEHSEHITYFLDPKNHKPGIPLDTMSYHWYSRVDSDEPDDVMQYTIFARADELITAAGYIETIKDRTSPHTKTAINELGTTLTAPTAPTLYRPIPDSYWALTGAMWAYLFGHFSQLGVDVLGSAEIIDYPGQFAAATMINWETGEPNTRYWVVKLLRESFAPGDKVIEKSPQVDFVVPGPWVRVYSQAFIKPTGERKVLLVNKRAKPVEVLVAGAKGGYEERVDMSTTASPKKQPISQNRLTLPAYAVSVVTLGPPSMDKRLSSESTMGELMDDPRSRAILERVLPELMKSPALEQSRPTPLLLLQQYAPQLISDARLKEIDEALAALPKK